MTPPADAWSDSCSDRPTVVVMNAKIGSTGLACLFVRGHKVPFSTIRSYNVKTFPSPESVTQDNYKQFLSFLDSLFVCPGNPDLEFIRQCRARKGLFRDKKGDVVATLDSHSAFVFNREFFVHTVRKSNCSMLLKSSKMRCRACVSYRPALHVMSSRPRREKQSVSKYASNTFLRLPQLREKVSRLALERRSTLQRIRRVQERLRAATEAIGIELGKDMHEDMKTVMTSLDENIKEVYPEGSFRRIFWEQQLKATTVKGSRGMRWHPLIIRWALNLYMRSGSAYNDMRSAGFIQLPSISHSP